jgi:DNA repair photolyase
MPLRLDTYSGCTFNCLYCFSNSRKGNFNNNELKCANADLLIKRFKRALTNETPMGILSQCIRKRMPMHFGGMSDPFQPIEEKLQVSLKVLRFLKSIDYPLVISTKSNLILKQDYLDVLRDYKSLIIQISFSTLDEKNSLLVEPNCCSPLDRIKVLKKLFENGIQTTVRWQPYIVGLSEKPEEFISKIAKLGVSHLIVEFLKLPIDGRIRGDLFKRLREYYKEMDSVVVGRELILPIESKIKVINEIKDELKKTNITLGVGENEIQYMSDTRCCCGVDKYKGFDNWNKYQMSYAIMNSKNGLINYSTIQNEWKPTGALDKFLNSKSRLKKGDSMNTVQTYISERWEKLDSVFNPSQYYCIQDSGFRDENDFRIFELKSKLNYNMAINKLLKRPSNHWQNYKDLFQITVFRYLVTWFGIVPVIAVILEDLPTKFRIDMFHKSIEYSFNLRLPFSWELLWVASFIFVVAFALYQIYCPKFIKKYNSFSDYLAMKHAPRWIVWESKNILEKKMDVDKFYSRIHTKGFLNEVLSTIIDEKKKTHDIERKKDSEEFIDYGVLVEKQQTVLYFKHDQKWYSLGMPRLDSENIICNETTDRVEKELFWEVFGRYSASSPKIRLAILIMLCTSAILFLVVFSQHIYHGLVYVIKSLCLFICG